MVAMMMTTPPVNCFYRAAGSQQREGTCNFFKGENFAGFYFIMFEGGERLGYFGSLCMKVKNICRADK